MKVLPHPHQMRPTKKENKVKLQVRRKKKAYNLKAVLAVQMTIIHLKNIE